LFLFLSKKCKKYWSLYLCKTMVSYKKSLAEYIVFKYLYYLCALFYYLMKIINKYFISDGKSTSVVC
jgi:hypothetical protein